MVNFVVDLEQKIVAIGGELHADAEERLLDQGSLQQHLWGGNIYPDAPVLDRLEYTALINIRPSQDNRTMQVESAEIREAMAVVVETLIDLEGQSA